MTTSHVKQSLQSATSLTTPSFKQHAYAHYDELRQHSPAFPLPFLYEGQLRIITRYKDANSLLKETRLTKNPHLILTEEQFSEFFVGGSSSPLSKHMLNVDPPDHTRLRTLVHKVFTPRMIEKLRPRIHAIASHLLQPYRHHSSSFDFIQSFAFPLPIIVISEMLGVPIEDRDQFRQWSNYLVEEHAEEDKDKEIAIMKEFTDYIGSQIADRRNHPKEDLISQLVHVRENGEQLSEPELFSMIFLLIIAGHETTVNLIGNGLFALLQHPEQWEELKKNPSLIPTATEEMLRYYSPVEFSTNRWALEDIPLGDTVISKGDYVLISLAAANRDPEQFPEPHLFNMKRNPNKHIAFGMGIHYCLGAPLARLEAHIAFEELLRTLPSLTLAKPAEELSWRPSLLMRGLKELPLIHR
ncbi:cytochrome P450 [Mechercharimyces sp. CAU 1602]|uniref:cytochrome P450 family protein n=1 Tax=Mechercharimyces sp. CAU 1602 TaxID=2973933 RepID=UPI002163CC0B|nr:cytochrome P450 [Mechercharimyces sp. CAU 1602]MCS1352053.1 cytochrome P450 [Mechercharimyces sp. CAU 1602]